MVQQRTPAQTDIRRRLAQRSDPDLRRVEIRPDWIKANRFSQYLDWQETSRLVHLVKSVSPRVMIEFGCNIGITAKRVLENMSALERYIGVDVDFNHVPTLSCQFSEITNQAGVLAADDPRFFLLTSPTIELLAEDLEPCNAVFIDGDHSEKAVIHESFLARELVGENGIIVWHDYGNPSVEVTGALNHLGANGWPIEGVENSWLAFMRT